ncbi:hypothetical protein ACM258_09005 [Phaeobacter piscinae]|uniref:hypothetical protein n=1 Tax=Phaeobacter piscinae TaxID=1580596 RepID=UPI0039F721D4
MGRSDLAAGEQSRSLLGQVRLSQVFVNLINNAADAMLEQEQREIHIAIRRARMRATRMRARGLR